jgi:hypothetical protein
MARDGITTTAFVMMCRLAGLSYPVGCPEGYRFTIHGVTYYREGRRWFKTWYARA